jgi:hypothetical protein
MMKTLGLTTIALSTLLLSGCGGGGGSSDPMNNKKYIIIETSVPSGVCESDVLAQELTKVGLRNFITRETDSSTSCATYGKSNDNKECAMDYIGEGTKNCVIGFDKIPAGYTGLVKRTTPIELYDTTELISASFK